jgi:hypothetical protein
MAAEQHDQERCPLTNVHRRMEDAHRLWHQAQDAYFDPDGFRVAIQSCIQQLRSVTWLLQAQKDAIPDFESWYRSWQERMRADDVMRWLVEARNRIEKRGDLEAHSSVRAQVIASYLKHETPVIEVQTNLFERLDQLFSRIPPEVMEKQIREHGTLKVERRWVANDLPDHELLDALSYVYGSLSVMIDDAHRQLGLPAVTTMIVHGEEMEPFPGGGPRDGRLPCMVAADDERSVYLSLKTGRVVRFEVGQRERSQEDLEKAAERYGLDHHIRLPEDITSLHALAHSYFKIARRIFLKDGYHSSIAVLVQNHRPILHVEVPFETRADKYVLMRRLADEVERCDADAFLLIGEEWVAKAVPQQPFLYAADMPDRGENLGLKACAADGQCVILAAEIIRSGDTVELGETIEHHAEIMPMLEPIRDVWRKASKAANRRSTPEV